MSVQTSESGSCRCPLTFSLYSRTVTPSAACALNSLPASLFMAGLKSPESDMTNTVSVGEPEVIQPVTVIVSIRIRSMMVSEPTGNESLL